MINTNGLKKITHMWFQVEREEEENVHITARGGRLFDQQLWCLPLLHAGIILLSDPLVLPCVNPEQAPQLSCVLLADEHAAGTDVSMDQIFAVKEFLMCRETRIWGMSKQARPVRCKCNEEAGCLVAQTLVH